MSENSSPDRILILTPDLNGADGISEVSRQVVRAFRAEQGDHISEVVVWSLADAAYKTGGNSRSGIVYRPALRNKLRFAVWGLQAATRSCSGTLIVVLHIHLAPVVLPLMARGARMALFLQG